MSDEAKVPDWEAEKRRYPDLAPKYVEELARRMFAEGMRFALDIANDHMEEGIQFVRLSNRVEQKADAIEKGPG